MIYFMQLLIVIGFLFSGVHTYASTTEEEEFEKLYGGVDLISLATGSHQEVSRAPAVATVITNAAIEVMGAVDLDEVLETVPGLHVSYSAVSLNPIYTIRGIHSEFNPQILMLINGIPITHLFLGNRGQAWGGMPVNNIARIEIIRGPGSALYGADAFSGTINIVTKTQKISLRLSLGDMLDRISYPFFIRVHRSFAVNVNEISSFDDQFIKIDKHEIPLGRNYKESFFNSFNMR